MTTEEDVHEFLAHVGVKGMKWGVRRQRSAVAKAKARAKNPDRMGNRNNKSVQRRVDVLRRVAGGKASKMDIVKQLAFNTTLVELAYEGGSLRGVAAGRLDRAQKSQKKIKAGKKRTTDLLTRMQGIDVRELNFKY